MVASSSSSEVAEKNDVNIKKLPTTVRVALDKDKISCIHPLNDIYLQSLLRLSITYSLK